MNEPPARSPYLAGGFIYVLMEPVMLFSNAYHPT